MIAVGELFRISYAAARAGADGVLAYAGDMDKMRGVLSAPPASFPWGTALLLGLLMLVWFAALTSGWIYLNRRARRPQCPELAEAAHILSA